MLWLKVTISKQILCLLDNEQLLKTYSVSTAKNGAGEEYGTERTPRGWHIIRAKIGAGAPENAVFKARRHTGEICTPTALSNDPNRDWIVTRILWLSGLERGKNRLGKVDTMRRYIYIHGTPKPIEGLPTSRGCIRMKNEDLIELFDKIPSYSRVLIEE